MIEVHYDVTRAKVSGSCSKDRAQCRAIFTTTTRNLSACDVIMKMVYCAR